MTVRYFVLLLVMVFANIAEAQATSNEIEHFAVFMEGKKIGYAIMSRFVTDGRVTTTEVVSITLSRVGIPITVTESETCIETIDGKPLGFEVIQDMGIIAMKTTATVDDQEKINMTVIAMGGEQKTTMDWPSGAMMAEGLRLLQEKKGLKEGLSYTAKVFSPGILQAVDVEVSIGAKQTVDLLGRVVALTKVIAVMKLPGAGEIVSTNYVDEKLRSQKMIIPMMGMKIEMVACAKEFALGKNDVLDMVDKMFLASPEPLENVDSAKSITYYLSPLPDVNELKVLSNDNQSVKQLNNGQVVVTVKPVAAATGVKFPYKGKDKLILEALKPTRYVQSDNEQIIALARQAVGNTKDAAKAAKRIEGFVAEYIDNKNLSVGYATAVDVAASKQGDCTEFAVLTTAMCRAVGIPAQVVVGIAYVKEFAGLEDRFGGHAWVQTYIGGKWFCLDASFKSAGLSGFDAGHIALASGNGNPEDFFSLLDAMGKFKIDKVIVE